jgi:hypothetical protein
MMAFSLAGAEVLMGRAGNRPRLGVARTNLHPARRVLE